MSVPLQTLVQNLSAGILDFQAKGGVYRWSLVFQKANQVADGLAKFDLSKDEKSKVFDLVPTFILNVVFADYSVVINPININHDQKLTSVQTKRKMKK